jgi:Stage II sporulation protein E (SpoIIE)
MCRSGSRLRAVASIRRAPGGRQLMSEASLRLGATLDLTDTSRQIIDITVPKFADAAAVFVLERLAAGERADQANHGQVIMRRLAAGFGRPGGHREESAFPAGEIVVFRPETPYARCVTSNHPIRFPRVDGVSIVRAAGRPGGAEVLAAYSAHLCVPLTSHGVVQGFIVMSRTAASGKFSNRDVAVARELSAVSAVSIDNALLYGREQRIAEALQQGLLPGDLATPEGVEVTHRYRPPGDQIVGGDWCDLIPLPGGRSVLIVGDAMGHGAEAAAVMAQLRAAANALAGLDLPPSTVLRRLDQMAERLKTATFATCVYTVLDPADGSCLITAAGHLPPVLATPDGKAEVIDVPAGLPLGLGAEDFGTVKVSLPPGAVLALYTDGLVENRERSFDEGIQALRSALSECHGSLPGICDAVLTSLCQHNEDDTTLVLARIPALPTPRRPTA